MTLRPRLDRLPEMGWAGLTPAVVTGYAIMLVVAFVLPGVGAHRQDTACLTGIGAGSVLALVFGVLAAARRGVPRAARRAWWLLTAGFVALNLIPVGLGMSGQTGKMPTGAATWGDLFRLSFVPFAVAGLLTFPRRAGSHRVNFKIAFDMVTILGGAFMVLWYFVIGPLVDQRQLGLVDLLAAVAYPIGDLVMVFGMLAVLMHGVDHRVRRPLLLLTAGLAFLIVNDIYLGYLKGTSHGVVLPADRWQYGTVALAMGLFCLAGIEQCRLARAPEQSVTDSPAAARPSQLPYLALALGFGLLVLAALKSAIFPWSGLVLGVAVMTMGVVARQILALRENHHLVITDSLTGLANRLHLRDELNRAFERSQRTGHAMAVLLIDMDGFKQINDTMGHEAGDELLIGFAKILKDGVRGSDTVARQGGDEFAIVLPAIGDAGGARTVAAGILERMRRPILVHGQPIQPRASIGIAVSGAAAVSSPAALLHHADLAMYQAKTRKEHGSSAELYVELVSAA